MNECGQCGVAQLSFVTDDRRPLSAAGYLSFAASLTVLVRNVGGWAWVRPSVSVHLGRWERPRLTRRWRMRGLVHSTVASVGPVRLALTRLVGDGRMPGPAEEDA